MGEVLEAEKLLELTDLPSLDSFVQCTSRQGHNCQVEAKYRSISTRPCPDPVRHVFWCESRYKRYLADLKNDGNQCVYCKRRIDVCWDVSPL
jgi:hypothetical protein